MFYTPQALAALQYPPVTEQVGGMYRLIERGMWLCDGGAGGAGGSLVQCRTPAVSCACSHSPPPTPPPLPLTSPPVQVKKRCRWLLEFTQQALAPIRGDAARDPFGGAALDANALGWALAVVTSRAFRTRGPGQVRRLLRC